MPQLVECIPNFSEARRPEVVEQIVGLKSKRDLRESLERAIG